MTQFSRQVLCIIVCFLIGLPLYFYVPYWYSAYQASRISDPQAYYQTEVGKLLLKYGTEYKLEPKVDTSDWNTYENKEYGFSFKYPKKAFVSEEMVQEYQWPEPHLVVSVENPSQGNNSQYIKNRIFFLSLYKYPKKWDIYFNHYRYLNVLNLYDEKNYVESYLNFSLWKRDGIGKAGNILMYSKTQDKGVMFASLGGFCFSPIELYSNYANSTQDDKYSKSQIKNIQANTFGVVGKNNAACLNTRQESSDINNAIVDSFYFQ